MRRQHQAKVESHPRWSTGWIVENLIYLPAVGLLTLVTLYWATVIDREPPLVAYDGRMLPDKVQPGDTTNVIWQVDTRRESHILRALGADKCVVSAMRNEIIDGVGTAWQVDAFQQSDQLTARSNVARPKIVPFGAAWGAARYRRTSCYECAGVSLTRVWPVCRTWDDVPFEIVPDR